jgi:hypothetical protein
MMTPITPPQAEGPSVLRQASFLEKLFTATPVILSVLATVLAGLSSRELTLAHYYRSLATQDQSKAGDQWNSFAARRIRGTTLEMTRDLLETMSQPDHVEAARLEQAAARLAADFDNADKEAQRLSRAVEAAQPDLGPTAAPLQAAARQLEQFLHDNGSKADMAREEIRLALKRDRVKEAFRYLGTDKLPEIEAHKLDNEAIEKAAQAVAADQPETALERMALRIPLDQLMEAIHSAEENAKEFEDKGKPVGKTLDEIAGLVNREVALVRPFYREARDVQAALADVPANGSKAVGDLRAAAAAVERTATAIKTTADELDSDFKAARHDYTARRYRREAQYNQEVAYLYEVLVRQLSAESEVHRRKSAHYFYAMLGAQAGVTIATLAMAMRYRSILWSLASVFGVSALLFASYVFMGM